MATDLKKLPKAFGALFVDIFKAFWKFIYVPQYNNPVPVVIVDTKKEVIHKHIHIHKYEKSSELAKENDKASE